jgi:hypothetical protein
MALLRLASLLLLFCLPTAADPSLCPELRTDWECNAGADCSWQGSKCASKAGAVPASPDATSDSATAANHGGRMAAFYSKLSAVKEAHAAHRLAARRPALNNDCERAHADRIKREGLPELRGIMSATAGATLFVECEEQKELVKTNFLWQRIFKNKPYKEWIPGWDDDVKRDTKNGPGLSSGDTDLRHQDGAPVYKDHYTKL